MLKLVHTLGATVSQFSPGSHKQVRLVQGQLIPGYRTSFYSDDTYGTLCDVVYQDTRLREIPVDYLELSNEEEAFKKGFERGYHVIQVNAKLVTGYYFEESAPLHGEECVQIPNDAITLEPDRVYDCQAGGSFGDKYHNLSLHGHMAVLLDKRWFRFIDPDDYPTMPGGGFYPIPHFVLPPAPVTNKDQDIPF